VWKKHIKWIAFGFQIFALFGVIDLWFLTWIGYWIPAKQQNLNFDFLAYVVSWYTSINVITIIAFVTIIFCISTIIYIIYSMCKRKKIAKWGLVIIFLIMTLINSFFYTLGWLVYNYYSYFA
jgi:hypothetical protein